MKKVYEKEDGIGSALLDRLVRLKNFREDMLHGILFEGLDKKQLSTMVNQYYIAESIDIRKCCNHKLDNGETSIIDNICGICMKDMDNGLYYD